MESILELPVASMVVALVQAHSHKKLTGFSQTAEICHERSSQAPGVGLGRNCRSLDGKDNDDDYRCAMTRKVVNIIQ